MEKVRGCGQAVKKCGIKLVTFTKTHNPAIPAAKLTVWHSHSLQGNSQVINNAVGGLR